MSQTLSHSSASLEENPTLENLQSRIEQLESSLDQADRRLKKLEQDSISFEKLFTPLNGLLLGLVATVVLILAVLTLFEGEQKNFYLYYMI